ncbi:MAG: helix-turn-helix transcriptional regulator [Clostridia bacterium]|nr:helix-turn-helix transcriptional regulator [Clostridia bacterium]
MSFGQAIKTLRRKADLTQEQLAEMLSISPQAVSRWETDAAMPDISMLPAICNLFDVSSDELLGISAERKKEKIDQIVSHYFSFSSRGYYKEAREVLEAGMKEYPNSYRLMMNMMHLSYWQWCEDVDCTEQERTAFRDQAVSLGERILEFCTEDSTRQNAIQILCYAYPRMGKEDKAVELANQMPSMSISKEVMLSRIYQGNARYQATQEEMLYALSLLVSGIQTINTVDNAGKRFYTEDEDALLREKVIAILHIVFEDGNFGFYHCDLQDVHQSLAAYHAKKTDAEKTLHHLRCAAEHAIGFVQAFSGKNRAYTSLLFRWQPIGSFSTGNKNNCALQQLLDMDDARYDFIRESEGFAEIKALLEPYAATWEVRE